MFIDASAIVAVLGRELGHDEILERLGEETGSFFVSPLVRFEAVVSLARKKAAAGRTEAKPSREVIARARVAVDEFIEAIGAEEIAISRQSANWRSKPA